MALLANHLTTYTYGAPVSICHTDVHLTPRGDHGQTVIEHSLEIEPAPDFSAERIDYFGNVVTSFSISEPHSELKIAARSIVEIERVEQVHPGLTPPWEMVRDELRRHGATSSLRAAEFVFESPRVATGPAFADYAGNSFEPDRPLIDAALDLCRRIYAEFRYEPRATTVTTPVADVLRTRIGVCQDFAHLMIACLRSIGLPARYVSGYLQSGPDSTGAEASHAWASLYCPGLGWFDFDPTNDTMPNGKHVTLAWGRDYSDVSPVRGVAVGGGVQRIEVAVKVIAI